MSENKRRVIAALMMVIWLAAGYIFASEPKTFESGDTQSSLIELFTSEGCSSCPPAEKWLSALKSSSDLWKKAVPVAFHVDYWDHLGWRDRFAKQNSHRDNIVMPRLGAATRFTLRPLSSTAKNGAAGSVAM
jgi:hypothetical protein